MGNTAPRECGKFAPAHPRMHLDPEALKLRYIDQNFVYTFLNRKTTSCRIILMISLQLK